MQMLAGTPGRESLQGIAKGVHVLTALHGVGAMVCAVLSAGTFLSADFRQDLAISAGAKLMVGLFGRWTFVFLAAVATLLACLAVGSLRRHAWAWPLTIAAYSVGVIGSLWEVSIGIHQAWLSAAINAAVVAYASLPPVRRAYLDGHRPAP